MAKVNKKKFKFNDELLRELREKENMSRKDLWNKIKISSTTLYLIEEKGRQPSFETSNKIIDFFNIDKDQFFIKIDK